MVNNKPLTENIDVDGNVTDDPKAAVKQVPSIMSFRRFIVSSILVDQRFGKTAADIISAAEIRKVIDNAKDGDVVELEKDDWQRLVDVIDNPTNPYVPVIMIQLASFLTAIKQASDRKEKDIKSSKVKEEN
jgi:uncharacterized protein (DUF1778 family)